MGYRVLSVHFCVVAIYSNLMHADSSHAFLVCVAPTACVVDPFESRSHISVRTVQVMQHCIDLPVEKQCKEGQVQFTTQHAQKLEKSKLVKIAA